MEELLFYKFNNGNKTPFINPTKEDKAQLKLIRAANREQFLVAINSDIHTEQFLNYQLQSYIEAGGNKEEWLEEFINAIYSNGEIYHVKGWKKQSEITEWIKLHDIDIIKIKWDSTRKCNGINEQKCNSKLIKDINELCDTCPILKEFSIQQRQTIESFEELEKLNSKPFLLNYLSDKIIVCNNKLKSMLDSESEGGDKYRDKRVLLYLHWKDCLNYYNNKLSKYEGNGDKNPEKPNTNTAIYKFNFKQDEINKIHDYLKIYFPKQEEKLLMLLKDANSLNSTLLFHGNGKTLLDCFKQLIQGQFLNVPSQVDFEKWITETFRYLYRNKDNHFTIKYANRIISGNERAAKGNRILECTEIDGKFQIILSKIRNREETSK